MAPTWPDARRRRLGRGARGRTRPTSGPRRRPIARPRPDTSPERGGSTAAPDGGPTGRLACRARHPSTCHAARQAQRPRRTPKFVLPDAPSRRTRGRTDGRAHRGVHRRPARSAAPHDDDGGARPPAVELDTRPDWLTAFRYEARASRPLRSTGLGRCSSSCPARPGRRQRPRSRRVIGDVIRAEARETDRAVRMDATQLPGPPARDRRACRPDARRAARRAFQASASGHADGHRPAHRSRHGDAGAGRSSRRSPMARPIARTPEPITAAAPG